jgi:dTDP-4-amino-4,6-dideoxy-D-galactose acyltransferase
MLLKGSSFLKEIPEHIQEILHNHGLSFQDISFHLNIDRREKLITWVIENKKSIVAFWHIAGWDSEQLGVRCAKIDKVTLKSEPASSDTLFGHLSSELSDYAKKEKINNFFFRAVADDPLIIRGVENAGFRTIGIYLDFMQNLQHGDSLSQLHERIHTADDEDVKDMVSMAGFIADDRFHRDGGFSKDGISRLWKNSIYNAATQWADKAYVYEQSGKMAGFLIMTEDKSITEGSSISGKRIFLIAVLPEYRRQGVGTALVQAAIHYSRKNASPYLMVGTQSSNSAAISLYQSCGFKLHRVCQELSWWFHGNQ